jgi:hypothetical protein
MDMGGLSIFQCLFQFLSSVFYSFRCRGLLPPWLGLFLGFFFFEAIVNGIFFVWDWDLNLGLHACKVSALPLEPFHTSSFCSGYFGDGVS